MRYVQNIKMMNETLAQLYAGTNVPAVETFPRHVTLTTTLRCNYRCRMCYQTKFTGDMDWEIVKRVEAFMPFVKELQIFGGEPLAYKRFHELLEFAGKHECLVKSISNGSLLTDEMAESLVANRVSEIKFSVDAGTPKTYQYIRGGNFFQVLKGIARVTEIKLRENSPFPAMHINFLAMRSNIRELSKLAVIAAEIGVPQINVFFPNLYKEELLEECLYFHQEESDAHMLKARQVGEQLGVFVKLPQLFSEHVPDREKDCGRFNCTDPWNVFYIDVQGVVRPCCGGAPPLGNILKQDFGEIWNNDAAQDLRRRVNTPDEPAYCKTCRVRKPSSHELSMHIPPKLQPKALALHAGGTVKAPAAV